MKKIIKPLYDRVLLKQPQEEITSSGVYVPKNQTERSQVMVVAAVGNGRMEDNSQTCMFFKTGDTVLVSKYAGAEIVSGGEKYLIVKQCDILAKIEEEK